MKPLKQAATRERPASLPTAKLTADIRPAGAVPSQQGGTAAPGCALGAKTNPDPTSLIRNLILQKDCRTTPPSPCTPSNCVNVLESYSCTMLKCKSHGMICLRETTIPPGPFVLSEPRESKQPFYNVYNTSLRDQLAKPLRMKYLQKDKNKPSAMTSLQKKVGGTPPSAICRARWGDCANPFRISTYGNKDLKSFRMRTYRKDGRGVGPVARAASTISPRGFLQSPCGQHK